MPNKPNLSPVPAHNKPKQATNAMRDYGKFHKAARAIIKGQHPLCMRCGNLPDGGRFGEELHHLRRPAKTLEDYEWLCKECHRRA